MDDEIDNNSHRHTHTHAHMHMDGSPLLLLYYYSFWFLFSRYYFQPKHMKLLIMYGYGSLGNGVCVRRWVVVWHSMKWTHQLWWSKKETRSWWMKKMRWAFLLLLSHFIVSSPFSRFLFFKSWMNKLSLLAHRREAKTTPFTDHLLAKMWM